MEELLNEALVRIKEQYGINFTLVKSRPGDVFPEINVGACQIKFNPKIVSFLTLYNLLLQLPSIDSEAVTLFRLYNLYLNNDEYQHATLILEQLEKEVEYIFQKTKRKSIAPVTQSTEQQILFILLHETAHAIFHYCPKVRTEYIEIAQRSIKNIQGLYSSTLPERMKEYMNSFLPEGLPEEIREEAAKEQFEKFKQYGNLIFDFSVYLQPDNDGMLEEFACDRFAWQRALVHYMEMVGILGEATLRSNIDILLTLHILDYDKALRNIFTGDSDDKQIELIRNAGARHASLRDAIWHFYKEIYPADHSHEFLQLSEKRDERAKRLLMCSTVNHIIDINTLHNIQFRLPEEDMVDKLEKRFAEIEKEIFRLKDSIIKMQNYVW